MKKNFWKVLALIQIFLILGGLVYGVSAAIMKAEENTVAIDETMLEEEKLTIYTGKEFVYEEFVRDFVKGDPANLVGKKDVLGIYVIQEPFAKESVNKAILANGKIITLDTHLLVLPRENNLLFSKDNLQVIISLKNQVYELSVIKDEKAILNKGSIVLDAWVTEDNKLYWMEADKYHSVYMLNLTDEETSILFAANANGVSHHSDEAQGAIVVDWAADSSYHGRDDLKTPNPNKEPKE